MVRGLRNSTKITLEQPSTTEGDDMDPKIIKVSPVTHKRLLSHGAKGETFDQIINRALDALDEKKEKGSK
jgi:hypothetical protein